MPCTVQMYEISTLYSQGILYGYVQSGNKVLTSAGGWLVTDYLPSLYRPTVPC